jgi:hypothetical protein
MMGRRVFARALTIFRKYDEHGVELVWRLLRPLYGGPDAGRVWYNTFAAYCMKEETVTPFMRSHHEPCLFIHEGEIDAATGKRDRINLTLYVDDGRTWTNNRPLCDGFYDRLGKYFAIVKDGGGLTFSLGMDISIGDGWVKIASRTYIEGMCKRWLAHPIEEYARLYTPAHKHLMDYYEAAFLSRGDGVHDHEYRSLVGALMWPAPTTRPDVLFTVGVLARAFTFSTADLFKCGIRVLIFLGQTKEDGIIYSKSAVDAGVLVSWSDSDWSVRRSTTGMNHMLAGGSIGASSKRQDCISTSSTHAEVIAASATSSETVWFSRRAL